MTSKDLLVRRPSILLSLLGLLIAVPASGQAQKAPAAGSAAPAPAAPAKPAAGQAETKPAAEIAKLVVVVPSGSQYTAYVEESDASPVTGSDRLELPAPSSGDATLIVLDPVSNYAAQRVVKRADFAKEQRFGGDDFNLVQKVEVLSTGKDDLPLAGGVVTLKDSRGDSRREILQSSAAGVASFKFVPIGDATVTVTPEGGSATTREVNIDLPRGQAVQSLKMALPDATNTIEAPAAPATTDPATTTAAPAPGTSMTPGAPAPDPTPQRSSADSLVGLLLLFGLIAGGFLYMKKKGITVESLLRQLGIQPVVEGAGGASLGGANVAGGLPSPGPDPGPPPIVSDPNTCQYCGQMKDASGGCACSVTPGAAGAAPFTGAPGASPAAGPRLVGTAGTYMGQIFPLYGVMVIGREPGNALPLDRDQTASRRHAQISAEGGLYRIADLGSANGTFVNGGKVSEAELRPGDEILIGASRFRFEA